MQESPGAVKGLETKSFSREGRRAFTDTEFLPRDHSRKRWRLYTPRLCASVPLFIHPRPSVAKDGLSCEAGGLGLMMPSLSPATTGRGFTLHANVPLSLPPPCFSPFQTIRAHLCPSVVPSSNPLA